MNFPNEEQLPTEIQPLRELIAAAQAEGLSFRYVNVLRHRLMDAVVRELDTGGLK